MATTMSPAATRMPFGEINASRLQNLTSTKNRQNALPNLSTPIKRKAPEIFDEIDSENIDPSFSSAKRAKGPSIFAEFTKPKTTLLVKPTSPISSRKILTPRAAPKINTTITQAPLSAPAGRSPTNKKRIGLLNRRRTIQRIEPPSLNSVDTAPFSLGAALAGTIPSYQPKSSTTKSSWEFTIHEDTAEEEMQILMEHGACTLDISSDEETARKLADERGKENIAPADDVSQSSSRLAQRASRREKKSTATCEIDIDRAALGELCAEEFYAEGVKEGDVVLVVDEDEKDENIVADGGDKELALTVDAPVKKMGKDVDDLMMKRSDVVAKQAALLEPIEKAEEGFDVWESGSAKDDE